MREVVVVAHRPQWRDAFISESAQLRQALAGLTVSIHHIGSTSVPGLCAKPVIDILIEVEAVSLLDTPEITAQLARLGYSARGENGIAGRRYFEKGGEDRTHQIHAFAGGSAGVRRHLAFRDYLRAHPSVAEAYGQLKQRVALRCDHDIVRYCQGKDAFIKLHEQRALAWISARGQSAGG
ncbi:GrpB family protein [Ferrimonas kyonanensis]|uniref:GrpB family protein n=1 Tax=Ferrimonas kyonanensis TaxID=364763 RepID=UPI0004805972|nr:GrpB family protein [Ferrimonas kyonanensis]